MLGCWGFGFRVVGVLGCRVSGLKQYPIILDFDLGNREQDVPQGLGG